MLTELPTSFKRGIWSHLCSYASKCLQAYKMYWLCIKIFYLFTVSRKCTHIFMVQVVDFPYLKLLNYLINVLLLKKLNEECYMYVHNCPCIGVMLTKLKKNTPACFCSEIIFVSFIALINYEFQSHLMKSRDLSQLLLKQCPKLSQEMLFVEKLAYHSNSWRAVWKKGTFSKRGYKLIERYFIIIFLFPLLQYSHPVNTMGIQIALKEESCLNLV